jgi:hypothetical protein
MLRGVLTLRLVLHVELITLLALSAQGEKLFLCFYFFLRHNLS